MIKINYLSLLIISSLVSFFSFLKFSSLMVLSNNFQLYHHYYLQDPPRDIIISNCYIILLNSAYNHPVFFLIHQLQWYFFLSTNDKIMIVYEIKQSTMRIFFLLILSFSFPFKRLIGSQPSSYLLGLTKLGPNAKLMKSISKGYKNIDDNRIH